MSLINQIRAFLLERGISFAKGPASLRRQMPEILENAEQKLTARMRRLLDFLQQEWKHLQLQIESLSEDEWTPAKSPSCSVARCRSIAPRRPASSRPAMPLQLPRAASGHWRMYFLAEKVVVGDTAEDKLRRHTFQAAVVARPHSVIVDLSRYVNRRLAVRACTAQEQLHLPVRIRATRVCT